MGGQRQVYFNGEFVDESEARLSIYDSALMFGDMVFEMTRSFNKEQFKLQEHISRLYASAKYVHIPMPMDEDAMVEACLDTVKRNEPTMGPDDEHRLMINVSRGTLGIYREVIGGHDGTNVIVADFPLRWTVCGMRKLFDEGVEAVVTSQRTVPASLIEPKVKSRNRLHYLMANVEVSRVKGRNPWALLLDPEGFVAEGSGANFFMVRDGRLNTPEPRNILRGISRAYVMDELAPKLDIACEERNIEPYDVAMADEAFFTATPFCILPVTRFNGSDIGTGQVGQVTSRLIKQWSETVGVDIIGQIRAWDSPQDGSEDTGTTPYNFGSRSED